MKPPSVPLQPNQSASPRRPTTRRRLWDDTDDEDPLAAIANLFDVALVFMIALAFALFSQVASNVVPNSAAPEHPDVRRAEKLERYRVSQETSKGEGTRLGTAYRLPNGDVVYVPD